MTRRLGLVRLAASFVAVVLIGAAVITGTRPAGAVNYVQVSGAGSTWSYNALDAWIRDVKQYGMRINYSPVGSSAGRTQFLQGTVDFAASDIPFQSHPEDGSQPEQPKDYAYMPITAGGTVFMYNLKVNGQRVTNLRLSGENITKIFTGVTKMWNDPAIQADNPNIALPAQKIIPVVRSDGSGSSAQFTLWMTKQYGSLWTDYCHKVNKYPKCGFTSYYPTTSDMVSQSGDLGVANYVAAAYATGAIGYVNYSYALNARFPVAKMLNAAGYYTEPTPYNVAVSLLKAQVDTEHVDDPSLYLTQKLDGVYTDTDARTYPLSSYSYLILPTATGGHFTEAKGRTLADFAKYAMCEGQTESADLGYSPMPVNLVQASFDQIKKIPGADIGSVNIASCHNPTFAADGSNKLADLAPQPQPCDKQGSTQCTTGTGGAKTPTVVTRGSVDSSSGTTRTTTASGASGSGSSAAGGTGGTGTTGSSATRNGTGSTGTSGSSRSARSNSGTGGTGTAVSNAGSSGGSSGVCDPSAGDCSSGAANVDGSGSGGGDAQTDAGSAAAQVPITLADATGWGATQTLMILVALLLMALVFAPGFVASAAQGQVK